MTSLVDRLRRPIDPAHHVAEIDGLRLLAIGAVVVSHVVAFTVPRYERVTGEAVVSNPLHAVTADGLRGVMLFFAISGFVLMLPFARAARDDGRVSIGRYFRRRLTRLEPPYLLTSVALFGLLILLDGWSARGLGPHLLAGLPYAHVLTFGDRNPVNPVTWSLEVEVQFYLLMPLLAWSLLRLRPATRRMILVVAIVGLTAVQEATDVFLAPPIGMSLLGSFQFFAVGILAADVYANELDERPRVSHSWDLAFLIALGAFVGTSQAAPGGSGVALVIACSLLLTGALCGRGTRTVLRTPWIVVVGGMCYSIYLVHYQLWRGMWRATRTLVVPGLGFAPNVVIQLAVALPAILAASALVFAFIERPCMRRDWPERAIARLRRIRPPEDRRASATVELSVDRRVRAAVELSGEGGPSHRT
jgi:peptidoglycan/LPS O-acetylase OafA/YrhL